MNILIKWMNGTTFEDVIFCLIFMISINNFYNDLFINIIGCLTEP
jgi:hypothetical protein